MEHNMRSNTAGTILHALPILYRLEDPELEEEREGIYKMVSCFFMVFRIDFKKGKGLGGAYISQSLR